MAIRLPNRILGGVATILLGYRGSGKTTVGKRLADRTGGTFTDTDALVVALAGRPIADLFADEGEASFRDRESAAIAAALAGVGDRDVIATGGGIVLRPENRRLMMDSARRRIYLACDPAVLIRRLGRDRTGARPALTALPPADEVRALLAARDPLYREVATRVIDVTSMRLEEVVNAIQPVA